MSKKQKKLIRSMERELERQRESINVLYRMVHQMERRLNYVRPYTETSVAWRTGNNGHSPKES